MRFVFKQLKSAVEGRVNLCSYFPLIYLNVYINVQTSGIWEKFFCKASLIKYSPLFTLHYFSAFFSIPRNILSVFLWKQGCKGQQRKNWISLKKVDEVIRTGIKNAYSGYYSNTFTHYSLLPPELRQASDIYSCLIIKLRCHKVCFLFLYGLGIILYL